MKKQDFVMDGEFKKKLLSKVFENGYAKTPDRAFAEKYFGYCGYYGDFPIEVEFYYNIVFLKRMDKPHKTVTNCKVMADFAHDIFGVDELEIDKTYTMDFEGAEAKFDFDHKCMSIHFFAKEKEVAA